MSDDVSTTFCRIRNLIEIYADVYAKYHNKKKKGSRESPLVYRNILYSLLEKQEMKLHELTFILNSSKVFADPDMNNNDCLSDALCYLKYVEPIKEETK